MKKKRNRLFARVLSFAILSVFLAGCGGNSGNSVKGNDSAQSVEGGNNIAIYSTYDMPALGIDPSVCFNSSILSLLNIYDTLLRYDSETDSVEYVACDKYEKSEDGLLWTFHIRENMKFHDGTPVNAEAVKFSFERTINMGKGAAFIWEPVDSFEVKDEQTLVMHLKYPAPMDLTVSSSYGAYIMSPAGGDAGEEFFAGTKDAGSGAYYIADRTGDTQLVLAAFEDYWNPWPDNHFDRVVLTQSAESSTRRQMLESGEVDFVSELPAEDNEALVSNEKLKEVKTKSFENMMILINTQKGPLQDKRVRQALNYAFPYEDVISYVMNGNASQSHGPVPEGLWGHSEDVLQYKHDLNKAKELLKEAGYSDGGFSLEITYITGDEIERKSAELYQSELNKLGITLNIRPVTSDMSVETGQNPDPTKRQDMAFMFWYPDVPSPYTFLYSMYHQADPISWNWTYLEDDEFDKVIDDANILAGTDRDAASAQFVDAQNYIMEEACSINIFDKVYDCIYNGSVGGFKGIDPSYPQTVFFHECYRIK